MQTLLAYIVGNMKSDSRVGRVLSGWTDSLRGGKSVTLAALDSQDVPLFEWYAAALLGQVNIPTNLSHTLTATLLQYAHLTFEHHPESLLGRKLMSCCLAPVSKEKLLEWGLRFREHFLRINADGLAMNLIPSDASLPAATVAQLSHNMNNTLHSIVTTFTSGFASLQREVASLSARIGASPAGSAAIGPSPAPPLAAASSSCASGLMEDYVERTPRHSCRGKPLPASYSSLKNCSIAGFIEDWYSLELHSCAVQPLQKPTFSKMCRFIDLLKHFASDGTQFSVRPAFTEPSSIAAVLAHGREARRAANQMEANALAFVIRHGHQKVVAEGKVARDKPRSALFEPVYKDLMNLYKTLPHLFPHPDVRDHATPLSARTVWSHVKRTHSVRLTVEEE